MTALFPPEKRFVVAKDRPWVCKDTILEAPMWGYDHKGYSDRYRRKYLFDEFVFFRNIKKARAYIRKNLLKAIKKEEEAPTEPWRLGLLLTIDPEKITLKKINVKKARKRTGRHND